MNLDTLNRNDLFVEVSDLAREQGVTSQEEWKQVVDEVIDAHINLGELDKDQDLEGLKVQLGDMWPEYEREAAPESAAAIDEDPEAPKG
jgi:hypothetical protein